MYKAAEWNHNEVVKYLIEHGAKQVSCSETVGKYMAKQAGRFHLVVWRIDEQLSLVPMLLPYRGGAWVRG